MLVAFGRVRNLPPASQDALVIPIITFLKP